MTRYPLYIAGRFRESATGAHFPTENPYTLEPWAEIARGDASDVDEAVAAATTAMAR